MEDGSATHDIHGLSDMRFWKQLNGKSYDAMYPIVGFGGKCTDAMNSIIGNWKDLAGSASVGLIGKWNSEYNDVCPH